MPIKLGIIGTGYFGRIHLECIKRIPEIEVVGFFDTDDKTALKIEKDFQIKRYSSADELIRSVEALDIVTPSDSHFIYAEAAIKLFKHVFIEKPMVVRLSEAKQIVELRQEANVLGQVGHIERFNPAYLAALPYIKNPLFIETVRLSTFQNRGKETSVVYDLLIHDIDLVLSLVKANVRKIYANGASVVSNSIDLVNARIEFDNGCVANLTASRVAQQKIRKARIFQKKSIIKIDLLDHQTEIISLNEDFLHEQGHILPHIKPGSLTQEYLLTSKHITIEPLNAIYEELTSFARSVISSCPPRVSLLDGYHAIEVANRISEKINSRR